ncbi:MAG: Fe-S-containing hydro-lyase [Erysipelotrichaceae bacterium]
MINLNVPLDRNKLKELRAGDSVLISGIIYTARDAAHQRMFEMSEAGLALPFNVVDQIIYYVGPSPTPPNHIIGSAGPTTSKRMDKYTPLLYSQGLAATIGKGYRSAEVAAAIVANNGIYLVAIGGAGALLAQCIKKCEVIAFDDLGTEAIHKLEVIDFPCVVAIDTLGNNLYE